MELEERLLQVTSGTFERFTKLLAKVNPVAALVYTGAAISPFMAVAFSVELLHQQELYRAGGMEALKLYNASGATGAIEFVAKGVIDALPSAAQNTMAKSMLALTVLPLTASLAALTANKFQALKDEITTLEQGGRNLKSDQIQSITTEMRGATRLSQAERFEQSMTALSRKIEEVQRAEAETTIKPSYGPKQ